VPYTLGSAHPDDVSALLSLWTRSAENSNRPVDTGDAVERMLRRDPDGVIVAREDGRLIGSVIAGWDGWRYHLYRLAVHPDHRRQGVAHALLGAAEERFRSLGARRIDAMVLDDNLDGNAFWLASGYERQAEWGRWVKNV
jgi:ribosomal protein S18 acetylase RimI-like enzyme